MAKCGKLSKLKSSVIKKWTSFGRITSSSTINDVISTQNDHFPVYVGKSRRRYLVDSETASHPIFHQLVQRSSPSSSEPLSSTESAVIVACEVVLFEYLLWMLQNSGNASSAADWQVTELVDLYACC